MLTSTSGTPGERYTVGVGRFGLVAEGKSNAAISEALALSRRAVQRHIDAIFVKLGLSDAPSSEDLSPRVTAALGFLGRSEGP